MQNQSKITCWPHKSERCDNPGSAGGISFQVLKMTPKLVKHNFFVGWRYATKRKFQKERMKIWDESRIQIQRAVSFTSFNIKEVQLKFKFDWNFRDPELFRFIKRQLHSLPLIQTAVLNFNLFKFKLESLTLWFDGKKHNQIERTGFKLVSLFELWNGYQWLLWPIIAQKRR